MFRKGILFFIFIVIAAIILSALYYWNQISIPASSDKDEVVFVITKGEGVKEIAASLEEQEFIKSAYWFEVFVFFDGSQSEFIVGNYLLRRDMNTKEVANVLKSGQSAPERTIIIIEGWSSREIADYLEKQNVVTKDDFLSASITADSRQVVPDTVYDFLADKPDDQGLEGYLFPDTYRIFENATSSHIIKRMLDNFEVKFTEQMKADAQAGNVNIYQVVTLASIIEKEVRTDVDRKIAAGIFYDRINQGVALQSDATVNYVTGKQELQPSLTDLEVDNPYNTYKYRGLPPGPISNPSLSSIMAAIYPEKSEYFYFLTKPDGTTVFSKTYDEHLDNKAKYLD